MEKTVISPHHFHHHLLLFDCPHFIAPFVNFINILRASFAPIFFCQKNYKAKQTVIIEKLHNSHLYDKVLSKMLMKLTLCMPDKFQARK